MGNLNVDSSYGKAGKEYPVPFDVASPSLDLERPKEVQSNVGKRRLIWYDAVQWQICHYLLSCPPVLSLLQTVHLEIMPLIAELTQVSNTLCAAWITCSCVHNVQFLCG